MHPAALSARALPPVARATGLSGRPRGLVIVRGEAFDGSPWVTGAQTAGLGEEIGA